MYKIETMLMDFTKKELAEGAELAASGKIRIGRSDGQGRRQKERTAPQDQTTIAGRVCSQEEDGADYSPYAVVDETNGELVRTGCKCRDFEKSLYGCRHITALLTAYFEQRDGRDSFKETGLERILAEHTGAEHPFIPGILRKTDKGLSKLLQMTTEVSGPPASIGGRGLSSETIHIHCVLNKMRDGLGLELKAGGARRAYIIKNMLSFLKAYETKEIVELGKSMSFLSGPQAFDKGSREIMDYLLALYQDAESGNTKTLFGRSYGYGAQIYRRLSLCGRDIDEFFDVLGDQPVVLSSDEKNTLYFRGNRERPRLSVTKQEFGALLSSQLVSMLCSSAKWIYFIEGDGIFRIEKKNRGLITNMINMLESGTVFVSEGDLPALCRNLFPKLSETMEISYEGMDAKQYLPEKPSFEIYLDLVQDNMISCRTFAVYREKKYQLFCREDLQENRDFAEEHRTGEAVKVFFQAFDDKTATLFFEGDEEDIYHFLTEDMERLEALGEVFISDRLKRLRVVPATGISVGVSIKSGLLEFGVTSEEFSKEELAEILSSYSRKRKYYRMKNGMFVSFKEEQSQLWETLSESFKAAKEKNPELVKLPLFRALYLDEMLREKDGIRYEKSREYRQLLNRMQSVKNGDFDVPVSLQKILRNYQREGFYWIKTLKTNGFGGVLADDMGLGKTLQVLAFLLSEKEDGKSGEKMRTLIVTPASLVYNWKREIERYTPGLTAALIVGTAAERAERMQKAMEEADVWITSYDLLKRDIDRYEGIVFANEIVDEAQFIKNQTTHAAKAVRLVNSGFRLALTGTPIENRLSELWSIFDYLMPGFLYTYTRFHREIEVPAVSDEDEEAMDKLRRMVHPFVLRRLKQEVLKELPEKQEEAVYVRLEEEQKKLYAAHVHRLKMYLAKQSEEEFGQNKIQILAELTKLRQLCCGPELLFADCQGANAKLEACMELIRQAIAGGHKMLLFSQFTSMLDIITHRLEAERIAYYRIDGSVSKEERMRRVDAFQSDSVPVFCISLKAGGTGLNLTAADIVIHYDPWWNLAAQNQATDRAHRIGQKQAVNVYQLIAEDTVEQKIQALQQSKYRLAEEALSGDSVKSIAINRDEIMELLEE